MASSAEYRSKKAIVSNRKRLPCLTREGLEEFKAVMQIRDKVECCDRRDFFQLLECLYQAMQTQEKSFLLLFREKSKTVFLGY